MKKMIALLLTVAMLVVLGGCANPSDKPAVTPNNGSTDTPKGDSGEKVTLRFALWDAAQQKGMEEIAAAFTKANPNITVKVEVTPWGEYWTKLDTGAQAKNLPDLFSVQAGHIDTYATSGMLLDITEGLSTGGVDLSEFVSAAVDIYRIDGKMYGLPRDWDTIGLWYNKEILANAGVEAPKTWEEIITVSQAIKSANTNVEPFVIGYSETYTGVWNLIAQAGGTVIKPDLTSGYDLPGNKEGLQFMHDLVYKHNVMPTPLALGDAWTPALLLSDEVAMIYGGTWLTSFFKENPNVDIAPLPKKEGSDVTALVHAVATSISAFTEYPEEAMKFIVFLASDEAAQILATEAGVLPAKRSAADTFFSNNPEYPRLKEIIDGAKYGVQHPKAPISGWEDVEIEVFTKILSNDVTIEEGSQEILDRNNAIFDRIK